MNGDLGGLLSGRAGTYGVTSPVTCVVTRFRLRSVVHLLPTYLHYRRVVRDATRTRGLLRAVFLLENLHTCYSLSIWADPDCIPEFGTSVPSHVSAVRSAFSRLAMAGNGRPELWSTRWRLDSVSSNLNWGAFDLKALLVAAAAGGGARS